MAMPRREESQIGGGGGGDKKGGGADENRQTRKFSLAVEKGEVFKRGGTFYLRSHAFASGEDVGKEGGGTAGNVPECYPRDPFRLFRCNCLAS